MQNNHELFLFFDRFNLNNEVSAPLVWVSARTTCRVARAEAHAAR
jgi:hypothetical protein